LRKNGRKFYENHLRKKLSNSEKFLLNLQRLTKKLKISFFILQNFVRFFFPSKNEDRLLEDKKEIFFFRREFPFKENWSRQNLGLSWKLFKKHFFLIHTNETSSKELIELENNLHF